MEAGEGGVWKHTRLRSPDEMELMELRLFAIAALTPRGVLSEDMILFLFTFLGGFFALRVERSNELNKYNVVQEGVGVGKS